jgi:uncharacterized OsmC-like protein
MGADTVSDNIADSIAAALERVETVLRRRPDKGLADDAPATAEWQGRTRVVARHANGMEMATDMPKELGGTGDEVSPGWLFRAAIASCAVTSVALLAAREGVALDQLEARVESTSDARGMFGMVELDGRPVSAAPCDMRLHIRIAARGVSTARLRALVETGCGQSPIPCAVQIASPMSLHVQVDDA